MSRRHGVSLNRLPAAALAAGMAVLLGVLPAAAQVSPVPQYRAWPGLTHDDLDRMHSAEVRLYGGTSIGTVERWRNPDTGNAGEIELLRSYEAKGMPCRSLGYTLRFATTVNARDRYTLNWCQVGSGDWKIVETPP
jgi:surface antigen